MEHPGASWVYASDAKYGYGKSTLGLGASLKAKVLKNCVRPNLAPELKTELLIGIVTLRRI